MNHELGGHVDDDVIDLREYVEVLWKGKWMIATIVVAAIAIASVFSLYVATPTYQATQVVLLPRNEQAGGVRLGIRAYTELASSLPVMEYVVRTTGVALAEGSNASVLAKTFDVRLDENGRLLTVTSSADEPDEAYRLGEVWLEAFTAEAHALWRDQLGQNLAAAQYQTSLRRSEYEQARSALDTFDRENPIDVLTERLSRLDGELATAESDLRNLTFNQIPTDRARLEFLEDALGQQSNVLVSAGEQAALPTPEPGVGVTASDLTLLNPVYLQLSQDLSTTRTRLSVNESRASSLENRLSLLPAEIQHLRDRVVALRTEREDLMQEVSVAERLYTDARMREESIEDAIGRIPEFAGVTVVSPVAMPIEPSSPRVMLNIVVAAVMGVFGGLFVVLIRQWWSTGNHGQEEVLGQSVEGVPSGTSLESGGVPVR